MSLVSVWHNDGSNVSTLEKKTLKLRRGSEEYVKWKEMSLESVWHNDSSNVSTLEKKTLKINHVLGNLIIGY